MLKVYVASIAVFTKPATGQPLGKNELVIHFLKGAKMLNPPRPPSVPMWDPVRANPFIRHETFVIQEGVSYSSCFNEAHRGFTSTLSKRDIYRIWAK